MLEMEGNMLSEGAFACRRKAKSTPCFEDFEPGRYHCTLCRVRKFHEDHLHGCRRLSFIVCHLHRQGRIFEQTNNLLGKFIAILDRARTVVDRLF